MEIKNFKNQNINNANAYLLYKQDSKEAILFDTANCVSEINEFLLKNQLELTNVFITHGHWDHIKGIDLLTNINKATIWVGKGDEDAFYNAEINCSQVSSISEPWVVDKEIKLNLEVIDEECEVDLFDEFPMVIYPVQGHTKGTTFYFIEEINWLFTGDTAFKNSIGMQGAFGFDAEKFKNSLKLIWKEFPAATLVYPGHFDAAFELLDLTKNTQFIKMVNS